jgi:DNA-binding transcriptional ArsR family regulator
MSATERADAQVKISWDIGTAYDFFISHAVLKEPKKFGIRSAWASGMRARLQSEDRETLDTSLLVVGIPSKWIFSLPQPKSVDHCLSALSQIPAPKRLAALTCCPHQEDEWTPKQQLLSSVAKQGEWNEADLEALRAMSLKKKKTYHAASSIEELKHVLETWSQAEKFGERLLIALRNYQSVFFKEEEQRIAPKLIAALAHAQARSKTLSTVAFLEEISQGIRYDNAPQIEELTLVPSYWVSPFIQIHSMGGNRRLWAFGARPANDSLVPGEPVPDALRVSLKALADPTRLRILRYLHQTPLTMSELTKRLRLRMPTVIHHLSALRLAGLVSIHVETSASIHGKDKAKGHRQKYGVRTEGLDATLLALKEFVESDQELANPETHEEE